jgi:hypothetical protein
MGRTLGPPAETLQPFDFPLYHGISDERFVFHSCSFVSFRFPVGGALRPRTGRDAIRVDAREPTDTKRNVAHQLMLNTSSTFRTRVLTKLRLKPTSDLDAETSEVALPLTSDAVG